MSDALERVATTSLADALTPEWHYIDLFRIERQGGSDAARATRSSQYVVQEIRAAILAHHATIREAIAGQPCEQDMLRCLEQLEEGL